MRHLFVLILLWDFHEFASGVLGFGSLFMLLLGMVCIGRVTECIVSAGGERGKKWQERVRFSFFWLGADIFFVWKIFAYFTSPESLRRD